MPGHARRLPQGRHRRLPGHHDARLEDAADRREVGLRRGPRAQRQGPAARSCAARKIPKPATGAGSSACAATTSTTPRPASSTTGPARSSPTSGSASYTAKGNKKFQPQFDVLADGWRQPGSAIKPIDYVIGIDDKTLTAVDDVHGRHHRLRRRATSPTQADKLERGPVRLRNALQFSLNIPAIKAAHHQRPRPRLRPDQGLRPAPTRARRPPVVVDGHRDARGPPDRPARRLRHDRQRRRPDAAPDDPQDPSTTTAAPGLADRRTTKPKGERVVSTQAAYIITDILAGNTDQEGQPVLGQVGDLRRHDRAGRPPTRRARRATTATSRPTATSRHPTDKNAPALAVGVWMGNSDNTPNDGKLSLDTSAPLWSAILTEISKGMPIADVQGARAAS